MPRSNNRRKTKQAESKKRLRAADQDLTEKLALHLERARRALERITGERQPSKTPGNR